MAVDSAGNVYLADSDVFWGAFAGGYIRKITPAGAITPLAGGYGYYHDIHGRVDIATFFAPAGVAVDTAGTVYVADSGNNAISEITATGVTTLAGSNTHYSNQIGSGSSDGTGPAASFDGPHGIAVDGNGKHLRCGYRQPHDPEDNAGRRRHDARGNGRPSRQCRRHRKRGQVRQPRRRGGRRDRQHLCRRHGNSTIRKISPAGVVTTVAGTAGTTGSTDATGRAALFNHPAGVAVDASGKLYIADTNNNTVRIGLPAGPPQITVQPQSQSAMAGTDARFAVTASGVPAPTYQWYFNGTALGGATDSSLSVLSVATVNAGSYTVVVSNAVGSVTSNPATLTVASASTPASGGGGNGGGSLSAWCVLAWLALLAVRHLAGARPGAAAAASGRVPPAAQSSEW